MSCLQTFLLTYLIVWYTYLYKINITLWLENKQERSNMKRIIYQTAFFIIIMSLLSTGIVFAARKTDKVVIASPFSPLVIPMANIVENNLLGKVARKVELVIWNTPDQLRVMITKGKVDFVSVPCNVASIFYNKGIKLQLARVSIWGVFYLISNNSGITSLDQLKGETIYIPFRGDQPDLIFQTICKHQGFDPFKDFNIQYASSPLDITMSLLAGKGKHAVMIEPAAAVCIIKAKQKLLDFKRVIDIQKEYGKATNSNPRLPNAGVAVLPNTLENKELVDEFLKVYDKSVKWVINNPRKGSLLAAKYVKGVDPAAFEQALKYTIFESISSKNSKKELEIMFKKFMDLNPKSIGGKLPDRGFYR